ncbi:MAG TPA: Asp-tRNA(Asn)/Glu-tRNA(Gln) amidotransferase subunit GatC [Geminicoccaceae bacterium]|nr:Asp-tRNA(Asn)/Glu-tRNA(Gln) amidotransferase subunit GatC [Geminicoccaceae bacterium]
MSLDKATVARIATLARIEVPEAEQDRLARELSNILGWIEQLSEVDTTAVEPMRAVMQVEKPLRPDQVTDGGRRDDILRNAPRSHDGYFVVPRVVE